MGYSPFQFWRSIISTKFHCIIWKNMENSYISKAFIEVPFSHLDRILKAEIQHWLIYDIIRYIQIPKNPLSWPVLSPPHNSINPIPTLDTKKRSQSTRSNHPSKLNYQYSIKLSIKRLRKKFRPYWLIYDRMVATIHLFWLLTRVHIRL